MAKITIDGKEYNVDTLPSDAVNLINMIKQAEAEIQRLQTHINMFSVARAVYIQNLKELLEKLPQSSTEGE